jgi:hypothetical protein
MVPRQGVSSSSVESTVISPSEIFQASQPSSDSPSQIEAKPRANKSPVPFSLLGAGRYFLSANMALAWVA